MPLLSVTTNQPLADHALSQALKALSTLVAQILGKPEAYVMISYQHNPSMLFAGNDAPLAYLELKSIGLPSDQTQSMSATLTQAIQTHLSIPADRVYIEFSNAERHLWGWNGGTFA